MKHWQTTAGGVITALGLFLIGQDNPIAHLVGQVLAPLGAFLTGWAATDSAKSA